MSPRGRGETAEIVQLEFMLNAAMDCKVLAAPWRNLPFSPDPISGIMTPTWGRLPLIGRSLVRDMVSRYYPLYYPYLGVTTPFRRPCCPWPASFALYIPGFLLLS